MPSQKNTGPTPEWAIACGNPERSMEDYGIPPAPAVSEEAISAEKTWGDL